MLILILLIEPILLFVLTIIASAMDKKESAVAGALAFILSAALAIAAIRQVATDTDKANLIIAKIKFMKPVAIKSAEYHVVKSELSTILKLIEKTFDKYNIDKTSRLSDIQGLTVYTSPFSGGMFLNNLGDVQRATNEMLKNINPLIDRQEEIVKKLIATQIDMYQPEFYTLNQELHQLKYSFFDGVLVRFFMQEKVAPSQNEDFFATGVNLPKK